MDPYPMAEPPGAAPRWGGAETCGFSLYYLSSSLVAVNPPLPAGPYPGVPPVIIIMMVIVKAWPLECRQQVPACCQGLGSVKCETCGPW